MSDTEKVVSWANWTAYLDYDEETKYPTLEAFKKQTGSRSTYSEDIEDNDTYNGKIQARSSAARDIGKDIIVFTDWMAARLHPPGLDASSSTRPTCRTRRTTCSAARRTSTSTRAATLAAPGRAASPASPGTRRRSPAGSRTSSDLWQPELKGRVEVLSEMRDTSG